MVILTPYMKNQQNETLPNPSPPLHCPCPDRGWGGLVLCCEVGWGYRADIERNLKMKVTVTEKGNLSIEEVYTGFLMRTAEGNEISVCMRDVTFEINIMPKGESEGNWWRVDMQKKVIARLGK